MAIRVGAEKVWSFTKQGVGRVARVVKNKTAYFGSKRVKHVQNLLKNCQKNFLFSGKASASVIYQGGVSQKHIFEEKKWLHLL